MRVLLKFLYLTAVLSCLLSPAAAGANTNRDVLEQFGFFGTWTIDCGAPASLENVVRIAAVSPTGDAVFTENLGPGSDPNVYVILRARRIGDGEISLRIKLNGVSEQEIVMRRADSGMRTVSNRDLRSRRILVKDSRVRGSGTATPWLKRCGDAPAQPGDRIQ